MAISAAGMVNDGVIEVGGAELERAILMLLLVAQDDERSPQTATAFIAWTVSDRDLIGQFPKLAFQMIVAGVVRMRHGGSEDSICDVNLQNG